MEDKVIKDRFTRIHLQQIQKHPTCGVIERDLSFGIEKIAEPVGVLAGIVPTTNPTATAIFKSLAGVEDAQCHHLFPHPRAARHAGRGGPGHSRGGGGRRLTRQPEVGTRILPGTRGKPAVPSALLKPKVCNSAKQPSFSALPFRYEAFRITAFRNSGVSPKRYFGFMDEQGKTAASRKDA